MNGDFVLSIPYDSARGRYLAARETLDKLGYGAFEITPQLLRLEKVITAATSYKFNFYEVQNVDRPTELKLNRNDAFFINGIGLCIYKSSDLDAEDAQSALWTWPNPEVFAGVGESAALEQVYNGVITFDTSPRQRIKPMHGQLFRYNPGYSSDAFPVTAAVAIGGPFWGSSLEKKGIFMIEPSFIVDGNMENNINLTIGSPGTFTAASTTADNVIVIHVYGFNIINGANTMGRAYVATR